MATLLDYLTPVDPRSDVFALGSILLECMTLEKAIRGEGTREILQSTMLGLLQEVDPGLFLPEDLLATIHRALSPAPDERESARQSNRER